MSKRKKSQFLVNRFRILFSISFHLWNKVWLALPRIVDCANLYVFVIMGNCAFFQGFVPGIWGVSHGAIQFMVYEEMKTSYNNHKRQPIDSKLVKLVKCRGIHQNNIKQNFLLNIAR